MVDGVGNTIEENSSRLLLNLNALVAVSKGIRVADLCCRKIL